MTSSPDESADLVDAPTEERASEAAPSTERPKRPTRTAASAAAAKTAAVKARTGTTARSTSSSTAKTTAARTAAVKSANARAAASKTAAAKATAAATSAKTTAAKSAAAKTAAQKAAQRAEKAAAKSAAADHDVDTADGPSSAAATAAPGSSATSDAGAKRPAAKRPAAKRPSAAGTTAAAKRPAAKRGATAKREVAADAAAPALETVSDREQNASTGQDTAIVDAPVAGSVQDSADLVDVPAQDSVVEPVQEPAELVSAPEPAPSEPSAPTTGTEDVPAEATDSGAAEVPDERESGAESAVDALRVRGLVKDFGDHRAVNGIDLTVPAGSFYGIVGPNGAGKTTTLSIIAGLLRPDAGTVHVSGIDQAVEPLAAKRAMGVLPDRLRTFDRLTGRQLLHYYGLLRGLAPDVIEKRSGDLARAFDLGDALGRVVSDYSAGMTKKLMLAGAMIHSPRVLVLDEPFEAVDPVSSGVILEILRAYVSHGGTVILSSHGMDLVERVCSRVAIIVDGDVLAEGSVDDVRAGQTLESRFVELAGSAGEVEGLEWLHTFSD
ncbi:ABC transporter ATP-binding protein [Microbacterium sp. NPDC055903]